VIICSDGLWNYQPDAAGLAKLALPAALTDPLGAAGALLTFALEAGGMDNITVVLVPFPLAAPPSAEPAATTEQDDPVAEAPVAEAPVAEAPVAEPAVTEPAVADAAGTVEVGQHAGSSA
jgi:hypothetical protein